MKRIYCSKCHMQLVHKRVAMPQYSTVFEMIDPHECSEQPIPIGLEKNPTPTFNMSIPQSVQNSDELFPQEPGDRRDREHVKDTSAPTNLITHLRSMKNVED